MSREQAVRSKTAEEFIVGHCWADIVNFLSGARVCGLRSRLFKKKCANCETSNNGETVNRNSGNLAPLGFLVSNNSYTCSSGPFTFWTVCSGWYIWRPPLHAVQGNHSRYQALIVKNPKTSVRRPFRSKRTVLGPWPQISRRIPFMVRQYGGFAVVDWFRPTKTPDHPNKLHMAEDRHSRTADHQVRARKSSQTSWTTTEQHSLNKLTV